jgi:hypothetical protein
MQECELKLIKSPISKIQLQQGFKIRNHFKELYKKDFIANYIEEQLTIICKNIFHRMISENEYMNLYNSSDSYFIDRKSEGTSIDKYNIKEKQKYKYEIMYYSTFATKINIYIKEKLFILDNNESLSNIVTKEEFEEIKMEILNEVQKRFPDSLVQIDPLKEYILIDWN